MSNYTDFINKFMNKKLNEAGDDLSKKFKVLMDKAYKNKNTDEVKAAFNTVLESPNGVQSIANMLKTLKITDDGSKSKLILGSLDGKNAAGFSFSLFTPDLKPSGIFEGFTEWYQDIIQGKTKWSSDEENKKTLKPVQDILTSSNFKNELKKFQQHAEHEVKAVDWNTRLDEWEMMGKVITYYCIEMMANLADKSDVKAGDFQKYAEEVFTGATADYVKNMDKIEDLMEIDAALGVLTEKAGNISNDKKKNQKKKEKAQTNSESFEFKNVKNLIIENEDAEGIPDVETYKQLVQQAQEDGTKYDELLSRKNRIKEQYNNDFQNCMKKIETKFETGRSEIIKSEQTDELSDFQDPLKLKTSERRIGRLGFHGPMTYIKNHPNINKAVEAIDGQQWNIFNCAAKLMIKLFKVIEEGSKALQGFSKDLADAYKQMKAAFNKEKIVDFRKEAEEIFNSKDYEPEDKQTRLLMLLSGQVCKYENQLFDKMNETAKNEWLEENTEGENKVITVNEDFRKNLADKTGLIHDDLKSNYTYTMECLTKLDEQIAQKAKEAEKPAEGEEVKKDSTAVDYSNPLTEKDIEDETEDMVKDAGDKAAKGAEAEKAKSAEKEEKKEQPKKTGEEAKKWQDRKFNFQGPNFELNYKGTSIGKSMESNSISKISAGYKSTADAVKGDGAILLEAIASFIDLANTNTKLTEGRFLLDGEVTISTITGQEFMNACKALYEKLQKVYPQIKGISSIQEIELTSEVQEQVDSAIEQNGLNTDELEKLPGVGTALVIFSSQSEETSSSDAAIDTSELTTLTSDIITDVKGTDRSNYRAAIDDIKKKRDLLVKKWVDFQPKWKGDKDAATAKKGMQDGEYSTQQFKIFFHGDGSDKWWEHEHIIPTIWLINNYFVNLNRWNSKYKIGVIEEATNAEMDKGFEAAFTQIDKCIPEDLKNEVYQKTLKDWQGNEYAGFTKIVNQLSEIVIKNKDKLKEDYLKQINQESADKFVAFLQDEKSDALLKLEAMLGYFVSDADEDETNGKLPDDLIKEIQQYTSTIEKIGNGSAEEVSKYKQQGQELGNKIRDAVKDNKELHDYIAEFLKRLGEATKETEGLYVISMVYAYNVFAVAEDLKPLLENFTKISNIFVMEGYENSFAYLNENSLEKFIKSWKQAADSQNPKKRMAAAGRVAEELKKLGKDANYITPNKEFNKSIVSQLKNDLSKLGGNSAESDQANSQSEDNKKLEELKAKLPDWLKKLIECANAGKKPVKISDYAKVYNPIKEEVGKYYAEIAEAKKIPEDKQAKDVLLKVIQLMSLIKEGEKKPEGENTPAPQGEQPKEGQAEQPQQQQQQQANMKDNLNWLANEFYKYIRG